MKRTPNLLKERKWNPLLSKIFLMVLLRQSFWWVRATNLRSDCLCNLVLKKKKKEKKRYRWLDNDSLGKGEKAIGRKIRDSEMVEERLILEPKECARFWWQRGAGGGHHRQRWRATSREGLEGNASDWCGDWPKAQRRQLVGVNVEWGGRGQIKDL